MQSWHRDRSWLYFCVDPTLMGFAVWGEPGEAEIDRLMLALAVELDAPPHASLIDLSRLSAIPAHGFAAMSAWLHQHAATLKTRVTKQALVRPSGLAGSVIAGFYEVQTPAYPARVHADLQAALTWLGREAAELPAFLDARCGELRELAAIRAAVADTPNDVRIAAVAKILATTERTLQRRLVDAGTNFRAEVLAARIERAKTLLQTDASLSQIAAEVGFSSQQHFNRAFKKHMGVLPSAFKTR